MTPTPPASGAPHETPPIADAAGPPALRAARAVLDEALARRGEAGRLDAQAARLDREIATARSQADELASRLEQENADVARLEGVSLSRIMGSLRGSRDSDLDRERAEAAAAALAHAAAAQRVSALQEELRRAQAQRTQLGEVDSAYDDAVAAYSLLASEHGMAGGRDLFALTQRLAATGRRLREVEEAERAGADARDRLASALDILASADGWSTYDTFFGGGMIASAMKQDRMDEAARRLADAGMALDRFRRESADVGDLPMPELAVSTQLRTLDVWFDNMWTDLSVRSKIKEALGAAQSAATSVETSRRLLADLAAQCRTDLAHVTAERDALLGSSGNE